MARGGTAGWSQRAFENQEVRCQHYVYTAIRSLYLKLDRPLRILELGCTNGGSLHCLMFQGVGISCFTGVDVAAGPILEAKKRFLDRERYKFFCADFADYCSTTHESFDVLLVKQTFCFLDQAYLEMLVQLIGARGIADRIVVNEKVHAAHEHEDSIFGDWGNVPQDYSHNYVAQFKKAGYVLESGGVVRVSEGPAYVFRAAFAKIPATV